MSERASARPAAGPDNQASHETQWALIRRRFVRHKLAVAGLLILAVLYTLAIFAEFFAPYTSQWRDLGHAYCPPQPPRWSSKHGLHVYAVHRTIDPITFKRVYQEDPNDIIPLGFGVRGQATKLWGLIPMQNRFFGVDIDAYRPPAIDGDDVTTRPAGLATFYLLGADKYGQDIFSRIIYGSRISLSIGIVAIMVTFILGLTIGGISGYVGGAVDTFIQRLIEILNSFPALPLWLALGAIMPSDWPPLWVYFGITIVLSLLGWTGLARVVRGKLLSLREEDYAVAAKLIGASHGRIIFRHLLPGFTSHIIVSLTLSVPGMILGETSLSFLGLGLRPPVVSWGVMLQDCMNMQVLANYPWLLLPVIFIVMAVLSCNFVGDGLRDAADPYSAR